MRVALYGSRPDGHANVVLDVLVPSRQFDVVGLIDDWPENAARQIGSLSVIGTATDLPQLAAKTLEGVILGFGAAEGREDAVRAIRAAGLALPTLIHPRAFVSNSAQLSPGSQVMPFAYVGPNARIGEGVLVNTGAVIEHDVAISDYSVIDPRATLTGRAVVGRSTEVGAGAIVLPDVEVGAGAVVGAGSVVTRPVPPNETVVGVPARPIRR